MNSDLIAQLQHTLVPLSMCLTLFGIVYLFVTARHRERMAMIERGLIDKNPPPARHRMLLYGILALALALGLAAGNLIDQAYQLDVAYAVSLLTCGGLGLLLFYSLTGKKPQQEDPVERETVV